MADRECRGKEYWKQRFDEYPQNECEKLAAVMMQEYHQSQSTQMRDRIEELEGVLEEVAERLDEREMNIDSLEFELRLKCKNALNNKQK